MRNINDIRGQSLSQTSPMTSEIKHLTLGGGLWEARSVYGGVAASSRCYTTSDSYLADHDFNIQPARCPAPLVLTQSLFIISLTDHPCRMLSPLPITHLFPIPTLPFTTQSLPTPTPKMRLSAALATTHNISWRPPAAGTRARIRDFLFEALRQWGCFVGPGDVDVRRRAPNAVGDVVRVRGDRVVGLRGLIDEIAAAGHDCVGLLVGGVLVVVRCCVVVRLG